MNLLMLSGDSSVAQGRQGTFYNMLRHFSQYWERIDVIVPHAAGAAARAVHGNVYLHPSPWPRILQPLFILRRGRVLMKTRPYALIVSHDFGFFYNGIGAWLLTRGQDVPYVSEIHHVEGYPHAVTLRERFYRGLARIYLRWVWRHAAAIRAVNQHEVPGLLRALGVPAGRILVLPALYIDYEVFRPLPGPRLYDVAFVGRLATNKGLFTLLDAIAQVRRTHPGIRLGMLGSGALKPEVMARIAALGLEENVTLIDRVEAAEDVARFYNSAHMLVCASTAEGGPRVTVEAMACGVPVISTPVGVMGDLIQHGENGLLFEWDAGQLAEQIRLLLDDEGLRARIAAGGHAAVQGFEAEQIIARYALGYQDLAARLEAKA
jgi:glycosyltransferase involved in cell wall biosynthesis